MVERVTRRSAACGRDRLPGAVAEAGLGEEPVVLLRFVDERLLVPEVDLLWIRAIRHPVQDDLAELVELALLADDLAVPQAVFRRRPEPRDPTCLLCAHLQHN